MREGIILLIALVGLALLGPLVWTLDPYAIPKDALALIKSRNLGPSWQAPLGTDHLGRDMLARLIAGARITLAVGFCAMALAVLLGTSIGLIAGYNRRLEPWLMRLTDMFLALPLVPILLVVSMLFREPLAALFGAEYGAFWLITFAIGCTSWMACARIIRAEVLALRQSDFIAAARLSGAGSFHILRRHILPNVSSPVISTALLAFASAVMAETALSVLGMGFPPDLPTWGRQMIDGAEYLRHAPLRAVVPGLAIALAVLSVHLIADGLDARLNPRAPKAASAPKRSQI